MAGRRMIALAIVDEDKFLDMPTTARLLYLDLALRADDDGFITPKRIMRLTGASDDDLKLLIAKGYLIPFESGVIVITHWQVHNYIRPDTYKGTIYIDEKKMITLNTKKEYEVITDSQQLPYYGNERLKR